MGPVSIVVTTYVPPDTTRLDALLAAAASWGWALKYDGEIRLIVEDDGSPDTRWMERLHRTWEMLFYEIGLGGVGVGTERLFYETGRGGVGASLNRGLAKAFERSPIALYAVDDWALTEDFDITPWVQMLEENTQIGCVRLGPPHPGISGTIVAASSNWQGWALRLEPAAGGIIAAQRPALWHKRFFDAVGPWKEDCSALECEFDMNVRWGAQYRRDPSTPAIVLALPHPWQHIDTVSLSAINPGERS